MDMSDGQTVRATWSAAALPGIKHFRIQRYDNGEWVPYDGFHGVVPPIQGVYNVSAPQEETLYVPYPGEHSFRIQSIRHDGEASDWITATVKVSGETVDEADTDKYYIKGGLIVEQDGSMAIKVGTGTAVLGGYRRSLYEERRIEIPENNTTYLACINKDGVISLTTNTTTPTESIRLANVIVDANNNITIEDTRFGYSPDSVTAFWDAAKKPALAIKIQWPDVDELNIAGWEVMKRSKPLKGQFGDWTKLVYVERPVVEEIDLDLEDDYVYQYALRAKDYAGNAAKTFISTVSDEITIDTSSGFSDAPATPTGFIVSSAIDEAGPYVNVEFDKNTESNMHSYKLYKKNEREGYYSEAKVKEVLHEDYPGTIISTQYRNVGNGEVATFKLTAINDDGLESEPTEEVTVNCGDVIPPKAPEFKDYSITGGHDEPTNYKIDVELEPVTKNEDGTNCKDLDYYIAFTRQDDGAGGHKYTKVSVSKGTDPSITIDGLILGTEYTFVFKSMDEYGNISENYSTTPINILVGGPQPQKPTVHSGQYYYEDGYKASFVIDPVEVDTNGDPISVAKYYVFRGKANPDNHIATVETSGTFVDEDIPTQNGYYSYKVMAVSDKGRGSLKSDSISINTYDTSNPSRPTISGSTSVDRSVDPVNIYNTLVIDIPTDLNIRGVQVEVFSDEARGWIPVGFTKEDGSSSYEFIHESLDNGNEYWYRARTVNYANNWSAAEELRLTAGDITPPSVPTVTATATYSSTNGAGANVSWTDSSTPTYKVYRRYFETWELVNKTANLMYSDNNLENGHTYEYKVVAVNDLGVEAESAIVEVRAGDNKAPEFISGAGVSLAINSIDENEAEILIEWDQATDASSFEYEITRSFNIYGNTDIGTVVDDGSATYSITDTVEYGKEPTYKVYARDEHGNTSPSISATIKATYDTPPADPNNIVFNVEQVSGNSFNIVMTWDHAKDQYFSHYNIYRRTDNTASDKTIIAQPVENELGFNITDITKDFGVETVDVFGNVSNIVWNTLSTQDTTPPSNTTSVTAESDGTSIQITWQPVVEVDLSHYLIEGQDTVGNTWSTKATGTVARHQPASSNEWTYTVKSVDFDSNVSTGTVSNTVVLEGVSVNDLDTTPPNPVSTVTITPGFNNKHYFDLSWTAIADATRYNIYIKGPGDQDFRYHSRTSTASATVYVDTAGTYSIQVKPSDSLGNENETATTYTETTIDADTAYKDSIKPTNLQVVSGNKNVTLRWNSPENVGIIYYEVGYFSIPKGDSMPDSPTYQSLAKTDSTYFVHDDNIDYEREYYYRIVAVDEADTKSNPLDSTTPGLPKKTGSTDMSLNSLISSLIVADAIQSRHLTTDSILGRHITSSSIKGEHLDSDAVTTRHLTVSPGAPNLVKNSAFGMRYRDSGALGLDWVVTPSVSDWPDAHIIKDTSTPIGEYALKLHDAGVDYTQEIGGNELSSSWVVVSFYIEIPTAITNGSVVVQLVGVANSNPFTIDVYNDYKASSWHREYARVQIPSGTTSVNLKAYLFDDGAGVSGNAKITGLKVEESGFKKPTPWQPYSGESYEKGGDVQINSDGIIVSGGQISITSQDGYVNINSNGIMAERNIGDGGGYAELNSNGLTVENGAFKLVAGSDADPQLKIDETGIYAYPSGEASAANVEILSTGAINITESFTIKTSSIDSDKVQLDSSGINVYATVDSTSKNIVQIDTAGITVTDGKLKLSTSGAINDEEGIKITSSGIRAYDGVNTDPTINIDGDNGQINISNKLQVGSDTDGFEIVVSDTKTGIYGYNAIDTTPSFSLTSDGKARFTDSVEISSTGGILIGKNSNNNFGIFLNDGADGVANTFELTSTGLNVNNANINQGTVSMGDYGIKVSGASTGIQLIPDGSTAPIVEISGNGISVSGGKGIDINGSGAITFNNGDTAIDSSGITADAIQAGTLQITGGFDEEGNAVEGPTINVGSIVTINNQGIEVNGGSISIYDGEDILMSNGKIQAAALEIGLGTGNMIKDGRFWSIKNTQSIWETTNATIVNNPSGIDLPHCLKIDNGSIEQSITVESQADGSIIYKLGASIKNISGSTTVEVLDDTSNVIASHTYSNTSWCYPNEASSHFDVKPTSGNLTIRVNATGITHITNLVMVESNLPPRFVTHEKELYGSEGVSIDENGLTVSGGQLNLQTGTSDTSLTIDSTGLYYEKTNIGDNETFRINSDGISIDLPSDLGSDIAISGQNGIVVTGQNDDGINRQVKLNHDGLTVLNGFVNMAIGDSVDTGTEVVSPVSINSTGITVTGYTAGGAEKGSVTLDKNGISIVSSISSDSESVFSIENTIDNKAKMTMASRGIKISDTTLDETDSSYDIITLGKYYRGNEPFYGLKIDASKPNREIAIESSVKVSDATTNDNYINGIRVEDDRLTSWTQKTDSSGNVKESERCELTSGGLYFYKDGSLDETRMSGIRLDSGYTKITSGGQVQISFNTSFDKIPHVMVSPLSFPSYSQESKGKSQSVRVSVNNLGSHGMTLSATVAASTNRVLWDNTPDNSSPLEIGTANDSTVTSSATPEETTEMRLRVYAYCHGWPANSKWWVEWSPMDDNGNPTNHWVVASSSGVYGGLFSGDSGAWWITIKPTQQQINDTLGPGFDVKRKYRVRLKNTSYKYGYAKFTHAYYYTYEALPTTEPIEVSWMAIGQ